MTTDNTKQQAIQDLNRAIDAGDLESVELFVASDPYLVHETTILGSFLHVAAELGRLNIVERLVEAGADVNLLAKFGARPINRASVNGHADVLKYLLSKGAKLDVSEPSCNPLFSAIYGGQIDCARMLIKAGMDPNVVYRSQTGKLKNALSYAHERGQQEMVDLLMKASCRLPIEGVDNPVWQPETISEGIREVEIHNEIVARLTQKYGPVDPLALQEIVPVHDEVHISIHVIRPQGEHPCLTLFTTGMSDRPMNVPEGQEEYQFAELVMHLPATWPHPRDKGSGEDTFWPFAWLRQVAYYPHLNETWLGGPMTIISSDDPPVSLGPNTKQSCLLLLADFSDWSPIEVTDGKRIHFYTVIPIYTEERDFEMKHGVEALLKHFQGFGFTTVVDINRVNVAK